MNISRVTIGNHINFVRTAELWNSLPSSIKATHSFTMLKTSLINIYLSKQGIYSPPG